MTYEEMMILTEQHLESQVFNPHCYKNYSQVLITPPFFSVYLNIIILLKSDVHNKA